jgi:DNA-binding NarL/FixJ family response regulator
MEHKRRLLIIEDNQLPYQSLKLEFEGSGWYVNHAIDESSTWRAIDLAAQTQNLIEAVVLDLGLPPSVDDPLITGLPLAVKLRARFPRMPLLAYTSLSPQAIDYNTLIAGLLPLRASFVYMRRMGGGVSLADLLELAWQGYVFLSPVPADHLPQAVAARPDPLNDRHWETLHLLSQGLSQKQVAQALPGVGVDGVKARVVKIKELLVDAHEIEMTEMEDILGWYRQNYVRYRRFPETC